MLAGSELTPTAPLENLSSTRGAATETPALPGDPVAQFALVLSPTPI